jgi:hypothetical protein
MAAVDGSRSHPEGCKSLLGRDRSSPWRVQAESRGVQDATLGYATSALEAAGRTLEGSTTYLGGVKMAPLLGRTTTARLLTTCHACRKISLQPTRRDHVQRRDCLFAPAT